MFVPFDSVFQYMLMKRYGFGESETIWITGAPVYTDEIHKENIIDRDLLNTFWIRAFGGMFQGGSIKQFEAYQKAFPYIMKTVLFSIDVPDIFNHRYFDYHGPTFGLGKGVKKSALDMFFFFKSLLGEWWKYPGFIPDGVRIKGLDEETQERIENLRQKCLKHSYLFGVIMEVTKE